MKLKVRYENKYQFIEVDTKEMQEWLSVRLNSEMSEKEQEAVVNTVFEDLFNKPKYNNWHQFNRHIDYDARPKREDCKTGKILSTENEDNESTCNNIETFPDNRSVEERDRKIEEYELRIELRKRLKPEQADLIIAVYLDQIPKQDYAAFLKISPSALSHRLETAEKNLKNLIKNPQVLPFFKATK